MIKQVDNNGTFKLFYSFLTNNWKLTRQLCYLRNKKETPSFQPELYE